ncbi:LytR/AlgR family response regulator transcription factor [Poritiphilus flavus]|uniref:Response regulator n=1 Tax=Poritiphilus flavus TaxID=2697053 RepID=A0A6L9EC37_9FLAO|nr:LytTR family DNA-binding domain-containing protein [Poritiphilus flavus]NAS12257.1 response regulator [Poritiphilus flavus]
MVPKLKAFIVENEVSYRSLQFILKKYFPEIEVLGFTEDVDKAISLIGSMEPDIVFLDIELKGGCGFQIIENFWKKCHFVITSYVDKYALKAISYDVTAYLLKPLKLEDLLFAINKAKHKVELSHKYSKRTLPKKKGGGIKILAIPSMDKIELIEKKSIVYLKAEGRYTHIKLTSGETKLASRNLGEFERLLNPNIFFRIHHSFIVNITQVTNINKAAGNYLELKSGESIPVAKRKLNSLNKFLKIK